MNHEDLEDLDLVFLTEVPTSPDDIKKVARPKKNVSIATLDQDHPRYEFEISYGISDVDDLSVSNEPIIIVREKDAIDVDSNDDKNGMDGKRKLIYGIFCVFLLIMIPIGIVVGLRSKNTENSGIPSKSVGMDSRVDNSSHVPSLSPSMPSEQQQSKNPTIAPINPTVKHSISSSSPSMSPTRRTQSPSTLTTSPSFSPVLEVSQPLSRMPSPSPSIRPAFQMIAQVLSLDGDKFPKDKESPSYQAISFLAEEFEATGSLLEATRLGQRYALASIYYSTRGSNWRNQLDFITSFHECNWNYSKNNITKGVICDLDGIVKTLYLQNNDLQGSIPEDIRFLSSLSDLDLSFNSISGPFPQGLNNLRNMERISLKSNKLKGTIPYLDVANFDKLKMLFMERNELNGNISSLCSLENVAITADCLGDTDDKVACTCCTHCCSRDGICI